MAVMITLPLFGKPGFELGEGVEVTGEQVRQLGRELAERLDSIGGLIDKLTGAGWDAQTGLYDVMLSHPFLRTEAEWQGDYVHERLEHHKPVSAPLLKGDLLHYSYRSLSQHMQKTDHFSTLAPINTMIAAKILKDDGPSTNISITESEIENRHAR